MNIKMPNQNEKDKAIEDILSKGLIQPKSLWKYLYELHRCLGFRFIFWDTAQAIILAAISIAGIILFLPYTIGHYKYATLFAISPMLFSLIVLFTETIERTNSLYELKMTCKYTIRQITAYRTLCSSLTGLVFCVVAALICNNIIESRNFFQLISLSLSALFLCAFLTVFIMRRFNDKRIYAAATLVWMIINVVLIYFGGQYWEQFISQIPVAITLCTTLIFFSLYLWEIKKIMNTSRNEVAYYVNG